MIVWDPPCDPRETADARASSFIGRLATLLEAGLQRKPDWPRLVDKPKDAAIERSRIDAERAASDLATAPQRTEQRRRNTTL
jgi:hypothetical protein